MTVIIVPKCPVCKTSKDVVMTVAEIKSRDTTFSITYCIGCYTVITCTFRSRLMKKGESSKKELTKLTKGLEGRELNGPEGAKLFRCKKCKAKCVYISGIGPVCSKCGRDWGLERIKKKGVAK